MCIHLFIKKLWWTTMNKSSISQSSKIRNWFKNNFWCNRKYQKRVLFLKKFAQSCCKMLFYEPKIVFLTEKVSFTSNFSRFYSEICSFLLVHCAKSVLLGVHVHLFIHLKFSNFVHVPCSRKTPWTCSFVHKIKSRLVNIFRYRMEILELFLQGGRFSKNIYFRHLHFSIRLSEIDSLSKSWRTSMTA